MTRGFLIKTVAGVFLGVFVLAACEIALDNGFVTSPTADPLTDDERQGLISDCEQGVMAACDDLAVLSESGTADEAFGATCGNRVPEPLGSCVDLFDLGGPTAVYRSTVSDVRANAISIATSVLNADETWDSQEAQLTGQERADLYAATEAIFEQAIDDLTLLQDRVNGLSPPSGVEEAHNDLQRAAVTLTESASGVLKGLQLPASAEQTPGTARRQAIVEFDSAATSFFEAADLAVQQST